MNFDIKIITLEIIKSNNTMGKFPFFDDLCYFSHSSQTLAVWLRKNVIQASAGFFCEAKL